MRSYLGFLKGLGPDDGAELKALLEEPRRAPLFAANDRGLSGPAKEALSSLSIEKLYSHQARALEIVSSGKNVMVATPTASGKTLIYNLSLLEMTLKDPGARGLYVFPLKALERDQLEALGQMRGPGGEPLITGAVYDGDTSDYTRKKIRHDPPRVIITNPDMLHFSFLPYHHLWGEFFRELKLVVIDEVHAYRGIFGSHMALVLKRLERVLALYNASPQFILLSATVANPGELAESLVGRPFEVITDSGAPLSARSIAFVEPYTSATTAAARLFVAAAKRGLRTIAFTRSRKATEIMYMTVSQMAPSLAKKVSSYRAGFLPEERRAIERGLASGEMAGVISTSALEMGMDIGSLDVCILVGYPGTIINTWQRGGRVGRAGREAAIVLVAQPDALDQYFMKHPTEILSRGFEAAVLDPENTEVLKAHLPCAASELPLRAGPEELPETPAYQKALAELEAENLLLKAHDEELWLAAMKRPHRRVDLRSIGESYTLIQKTKKGSAVMGRSDGIRVFKECHPGALYLHRGKQYQVKSLDIERRDVHLVEKEVNYYTRALTEKETDILEVLSSRPVKSFVARLGRLKVTERVVGFEKRKLFTGELLESAPLELPPLIFETVGLWMEMEPELPREVSREGLHFMGGIHALEHAAISLFPLFALCDRNDVGGIAHALHPQLKRPAVFIYDGYPGGVGLAVRGFSVIEELLSRTLEMLRSCPCEEGCPSCIQSPKCGSGNKPLDKDAAVLTLTYLLGERPLGMATGPPAVDEPGEEPADARPRARIGYFDLETQRLAQEVGGWDKPHLMGLSVAVLLEEGSEPEVFYERDVPALIKRLGELDLVVGFNIRKFDYGVLSGYADPGLFKRLPTLDILHDLHEKCRCRRSLDHLAEHTLGARKSADGLKAVQWFREGEMEKLTEYCKNDVYLTRDLFRFGLREGYLVMEKAGSLVRVSLGWSLPQILGTKVG